MRVGSVVHAGDWRTDANRAAALSLLHASFIMLRTSLSSILVLFFSLFSFCAAKVLNVLFLVLSFLAWVCCCVSFGGELMEVKTDAMGGTIVSKWHVSQTGTETEREGKSR